MSVWLKLLLLAPCNVTCLSQGNTNGCLYWYFACVSATMILCSIRCIGAIYIQWWCLLAGNIQDTDWSHQCYLGLVTCVHYLHYGRCMWIHSCITTHTNEFISEVWIGIKRFLYNTVFYIFHIHVTVRKVRTELSYSNIFFYPNCIPFPQNNGLLPSALSWVLFFCFRSGYG